MKISRVSGLALERRRALTVLSRKLRIWYANGSSLISAYAYTEEHTSAYVCMRIYTRGYVCGNLDEGESVEKFAANICQKNRRVVPQFLIDLIVLRDNLISMMHDKL